MAHLENVEITPNPVNAGKQYMLRVTISTWDYLKKITPGLNWPGRNGMM